MRYYKEKEVGAKINKLYFHVNSTKEEVNENKNIYLKDLKSMLEKDGELVIHENFNLFSKRITNKCRNNQIIRQTIGKSIYNYIINNLRDYKDDSLELKQPTFCLIKDKSICLIQVKYGNEKLTKGEENFLLLAKILGQSYIVYYIVEDDFKEELEIEECKGIINLEYEEYWNDVLKDEFGEDILLDTSFIGEIICDKCGYPILMNWRYDSALCVKCNEWFEKNCGDPYCEYCSNRPIKPLC